MKLHLLRTVSGLALFVSAQAHAYTPLAGDIVFHTSLSSQSKAVQAATHSPYSHMGVVLFREGRAVVFEAVQPVKYTPLQQWLNRGEGQHYVIKRLKSPLTEAQLKRLYQQSTLYESKPYDLAFEWSNDKIYCSELVWKLYKAAANIELAPLAKLGSFDLSHPVVKAKLEERYGSQVPLDEPVIAPSAIFHSSALQTVSER